MTKKERERLKIIVYEAYMEAQARGEKTEVIRDALAVKHNVSSKTIERWVAEIFKRREAMMGQMKATISELETTINGLKEKIRILASGDFYPDWETGEPIKPERSKPISDDGILLV